jgi:uncharacterized protein DUF5996
MSDWPALPLEEWWDTRETLHRWTQIIGKIRTRYTPLINHWWNSTLYVTARGLTTSKIPHGEQWFDIEFDFIAHLLRIRVSDGRERAIALSARSVADFYRDVFASFDALEVHCTISPIPQECEDKDRLDLDESRHTYDPEFAQRFWRALGLVDTVFNQFRVEFIGKCSPVHFFWGSFDLAVTRFSGRRAPERPGADAVTREAYSHEVSSVGFWPGDRRLMKPSFYSYAAPEPAGFRTSPVRPAQTYYNETFGGFYLDYEIVRRAADPAGMLLDFCHSTYEAAANNGHWDRSSLERRQ